MSTVTDMSNAILKLELCYAQLVEDIEYLDRKH